MEYININDDTISVMFPAIEFNGDYYTLSMRKLGKDDRYYKKYFDKKVLCMWWHDEHTHGWELPKGPVETHIVRNSSKLINYFYGDDILNNLT